MNDPRIIPAEAAVAVTPSDSTVFAPTRYLYVGVAGDVTVKMADGNNVTFTELAAGVLHAISVVQVLSTGTAATNIVRLN